MLFRSPRGAAAEVEAEGTRAPGGVAVGQTGYPSPMPTDPTTDPRTPSGPLPAHLLRAHLYGDAARRSALAVELGQLGRERPDLRPLADLVARSLLLQSGTDAMIAAACPEPPRGWWARVVAAWRMIRG